MADWTHNDLKTLKFLLKHFEEDHSINQLAKQIGITPKGMHKLLTRLGSQNILIAKKIGNGIFYHINFQSELALAATQLSLFEEIKLPYAKAQAKDLQRLRPYTQAAILFGSVLDKGERAGDIDVLFILDERKYDPFKKALASLRSLKSKPIQDIIQTPEDLSKNLKKRDKVILDALKNGNVLWGQDILIQAVKEAI
ncbi:MAG TPA: hypothetical protein VJH22_05925 [Candidatus Nanoarchaeia archaeon]|nr:hypothetical protein [Candidatus Nanoarchaeia archaeon]